MLCFVLNVPDNVQIDISMDTVDCLLLKLIVGKFKFNLFCNNRIQLVLFDYPILRRTSTKIRPD